MAGKDKNKEPKDIAGAPGAAAPEGINNEITDAQAAQLRSGVPMIIHGQYVKDLSFENPHAPDALWAKLGQPVMDINFSMGAKNIKVEKADENAPDLFEVTLGVTATAKRDDMVAYIAEVEYAVLVSLNNVPEEQRHPTLLIKIPEFAFPFVRQILANLTQQGGYVPLLLAPVDFRAMYIERFGEKNAQKNGKAANG